MRPLLRACMRTAASSMHAYRRAAPSECATKPLVCGISTPPTMTLYGPSSRRCRSKPCPSRKGSAGLPSLSAAAADVPPLRRHGLSSIGGG
eukprot:308288-Chlamydomonas_euryale.AAC.2